MPSGALWRLQYEDSIDQRIQCRVDRARFAFDSQVLSTRIYRDEPNQNWRVYILEVQLQDDLEDVDSNSLRGIRDRHPLSPLNQPLTNQSPVGFSRLSGTPNGNGDSILPEIRDQIIAQALSSTEGRSRLAAAMVAPLRARRDYQSVARRVFMVEQMPEGALPIYGVDLNPHRVECPEWLIPGAWITDGTNYAQVVSITGARVEILPWRACGIPVATGVTAIVVNWRLCEEPVEPQTRFERILLNDE